MLTNSFLTYYSRHEYPVLSTDLEALRRLILDFKAGVDYARDFALYYVCSYLRSIFTAEELRGMYFVPVPAATMDRSCDRWCIFTHDVCRELGMRNGYDIWCNSEDVEPSHVTRMAKGEDGQRAKNYFFTKEIEGAKCVVFDDIFSTGASLQLFCDTLIHEEHAEVVALITLATTKK